ncbi:MBL fold metallo-hydrolase [Saccharothrix sp. Mg75]|uniref:MBL fold metallo-hydrolase n=1 Tax=Saccharothrix sp. Mg75 TaxID=3445357 RepID=UPI003EE965B4
MELTRIDDHVHVATGTNVNWALVDDGSSLTLVDAGYPRDLGALLASIEAVGRRPEDVTAVVLTHAHLDHMGGIPAVVARCGAPVMTGAEEARHARREYLEQITPVQMLRQCTRVAGVRWVADTVRAVGLANLKMKVDDVVAVEPGVPLDVPGGLVAVPTPGHTRGHTAYLMPSTGVLFSGDTLVTGHPISRLGTGAQKLPAVFNESEEGVERAVAGLRDLPADTLVPGHGRHVQAPVATLVDRALNR